MMQHVTLPEERWQQIIAIIAKAPWDLANPILMDLSAQLGPQRTPRPNGPAVEGQERQN